MLSRHLFETSEFDFETNATFVSYLRPRAWVERGLPTHFGFDIR